MRKVKQYFGGKLDGALVSSWMKEKKHIIGLVEFFCSGIGEISLERNFEGSTSYFLVDNIPLMGSLIEGISTERQ